MKDKIELPEHLQRVIVEKTELKVKLDALIAFLNKGQPEFISDRHWELLDKQYKHMKEYHSILRERIADAIDDL